MRLLNFYNLHNMKTSITEVNTTVTPNDDTAAALAPKTYMLYVLENYPKTCKIKNGCFQERTIRFFNFKTPFH